MNPPNFSGCNFCPSPSLEIELCLPSWHFSMDMVAIYLTSLPSLPTPSPIGIELCLPGWRFSMTMVASFLMVGGQLVMPGVAALCRDWPVQDDWQVLQIMIICPFILMLPYVW